MAANKLLEQGGAQTLQIACPATVGSPATQFTVESGQPLVLGTLACVALVSSPPLLQPGTNIALQLPAPGFISVDLAGVYSLEVTAATVLSPQTGSAVNPGDKIYAAGGSTTSDGSNLTYGFTLSKVSTGILFGTAVSVGGAAGPLLASGETGFIAVRLKEAN